MVLTKILGNLSDPAYDGIPRQKIDYLLLDYETARKRILRQKTEGGRDISLRLCPEAQLKGLYDGDVLMQKGDMLVAVKILPVPALLMEPRSLMETASLCYEVGNRHAPLYALQGEKPVFAVLYDGAMETLIRKLGVPCRREALPLEERCRMKLHAGAHHHKAGHSHG